jgi:uncharacterized protein YbjT (DUF2867 family)
MNGLVYTSSELERVDYKAIAVSRPRLIAVLGCTGNVGSEVMRALSKEDCAVRGILTKSNRTYPVPLQNEPARISYTSAAHTSVEHLSHAFMGVDVLFLSIGTNPQQVAIELRAIEAAQRAGVHRIVKMSAPIVAEPASVEVAKWHQSIEEKLESSGLEFCNLRPYSFMQNWLRNTFTIQHLGKIIGSAGSSPRNYVDCRDVAEIALRLLLSEHPLTMKVVTITGSEAISNQDMAERLSLATGSTVRYENLSRAEHYQVLLRRAKLPEWLARHLVELEELARLVPEQPDSEFQTLLRHPPRTIDEFIQENRSAFMRQSGIVRLFNR